MKSKPNRLTKQPTNVRTSIESLSRGWGWDRDWNGVESGWALELGMIWTRMEMVRWKNSPSTPTSNWTYKWIRVESRTSFASNIRSYSSTPKHCSVLRLLSFFQITIIKSCVAIATIILDAKTYIYTEERKIHL